MFVSTAIMAMFILVVAGADLELLRIFFLYTRVHMHSTCISASLQPAACIDRDFGTDALAT